MGVRQRGRAPLPPCAPGLCYVYDGTWEGWLCCVFHSYVDKEIPERVVWTGDAAAGSLFGMRQIRTDDEEAARVLAGMEARLGLPFVRTLQRTFCTCLAEKEWHMLQLTRKAFRYGTEVLLYEDDETVHQIHRALTRLGSEIDKWWGFVRFSDVHGVLVSVIGPKNCVLPFLAPHFCARYKNERFLIFDEVHHMALVHRPGETAIIPMDGFRMADPSLEEQYYRRLWKLYYDTIEIRQRHNETCRRTHMPKRYWQFLTEFMTVPHVAAGLQK
jgi:probable DNA metabolism protein